MRPQSIGYAASFLILGGLLGLNLDLTLAALTIGLWCTSWTWGPLVTIPAVLAGIGVLAAGPSKPVQVLGFLAACGLISDFVNLNIFSVCAGIGAMAALFQPTATAYYRGRWEPPFPAELEPGQSGVLLNTSFVPIAFLLYCCVTKLRIDGEVVHRLPWGTSAIPLAPGPHKLQCEVPYLIGGVHAASLELEVPEGAGLDVRYHAPGWLIFLPGQLRVRG